MPNLSQVELQNLRHFIGLNAKFKSSRITKLKTLYRSS